MNPLAGPSVRTKWTLGATALALVLIVVAVVVNGQRSLTSAGRSALEGPSPTVAITQSPSGARSLTPEEQLELEKSITRMRDVMPVNAATSPRYPAVSAEARQ